MFSNDDHLNGRKADEAEEEDADQETPQPKESETPTPAEAAGSPSDATSKPKSQIEENSGASFPGYNLDIKGDLPIDQVNQYRNGSLCNEREIILVELKDLEQGEFTFKFSPNKEDYTACAHPKCKKIGIFQHFSCVCQKVFYCSVNCRDTDTAH